MLVIHQPQSALALTYMDIERLLHMVNTKCPTKLALTEQIVERHSRSNRDARPELLPTSPTVDDGVDKMLYPN